MLYIEDFGKDQRLRYREKESYIAGLIEEEETDMFICI